MNNIIENYYYIIILIGVFVVFALIGYLVELTKRNKVKYEDIKEEIVSSKPIDDIIEEEIIEEKIEEVNVISKDDELLNDYNSFDNKKE